MYSLNYHYRFCTILLFILIDAAERELYASYAYLDDPADHMDDGIMDRAKGPGNAKSGATK